MHWLMKLPWYSTLESIGANGWGDWRSKRWDLNNRFPPRTNRVQYFPRHVFGTSQPMCLYFPLSQFCTSLHDSHFFMQNLRGTVYCPIARTCTAHCMYYPGETMCIAQELLPVLQWSHCFCWPLHIMPWSPFLYCPEATPCTAPEPLSVLLGSHCL